MKKIFIWESWMDGITGKIWDTHGICFATDEKSARQNIINGLKEERSFIYKNFDPINKKDHHLNISEVTNKEQFEKHSVIII